MRWQNFDIDVWQRVELLGENNGMEFILKLPLLVRQCFGEQSRLPVRIYDQAMILQINQSGFLEAAEEDKQKGLVVVTIATNAKELAKIVLNGTRILFVPGNIVREMLAKEKERGKK